jgi:hypothetical protein
MRPLADYYTGQAFASLLVSALKVEEPLNALDLGAGRGALLTALNGRWPTVRLHAAELDSGGCLTLSKRFPELKLFRGSGLSGDLLGALQLDCASIDVAVCNPPYLTHEHNNFTQHLLRDAGIEGCLQLKKLSSDLLFLAQNLRLLRNGGELGIILPDTLISGYEYAPFREALLTNHGVFGVIQIPSLAFAGAEAQTHALLIRRGCSTNDLVSLWQSAVDGGLRDEVKVPSNLLIHRMDHGYHAWRVGQSTADGPTLTELNAEIKRGSLTHSQCRERGLDTFHTGDFESTGLIRLVRSPQPHGVISAEVGDILIARVGTRCIGRVGRVVEGHAAITDCVYRLRVPDPWREPLWRSLRSQAGQAWLQANAYGVCARSISKRDLLRFRVTTVP